MKNVIIHVWKIMRPVVLKFDVRDFDGEGGFCILFEKSKPRVNWNFFFFVFLNFIKKKKIFKIKFSFFLKKKKKKFGV